VPELSPISGFSPTITGFSITALTIFIKLTREGPKKSMISKLKENLVIGLEFSKECDEIAKNEI
jgi:hypothetical protein